MSAENRRLASALAAAGLSARGVAAEVLLMLPESFVEAYERAYLGAFGAAVAGTQRRDGDVQRAIVRRRPGTRSNERSEIGVAGPVTAAGGSRVPVADERALAAKGWADRKLRAIARELDARLTGRGYNPVRRKCTGRCKKWADAEWMYCPWCGGPTEDVERG